jgi:CSLREA domain-containing protein
MPRLVRGALVAAAALLCLPATAGAATVAVNTTDDQFNNGSGCSLREAVESVNTGVNVDSCVATIFPDPYGTNDTITLAASTTYTLTRNGLDDSNDSGDLDVSNPVTISGGGSNSTIINQGFTPASNNDRILEATSDDDLHLSGFNLAGGRATQTGDAIGGCINANGASPTVLSLDDVRVSGCIASDSGGGRGGGIASNRNVTIDDDSTIDNNKACDTGCAGSTGQGGGVYIVGADSALTLAGSEIVSNQAGGANGELNISGLGGGIYFNVAGDTSLTITASIVTGNTAGGGTLSAESFGGGIFVAGVGTNTLSATLGSDISTNSAGGGANDAQGNGGGLYFDTQTGSVSITDSTVNSNEAGGAGGDGVGDGAGIESARDVSVTGSSVSNNDAAVGGAGSGFGGGISMFAGAGADPDLTISESQVNDNTAGDQQGIAGGILMGGEGNLSITDVTLSANTAAGAGGGILRTEPDNGMLPADSITRTEITGNHAGNSLLGASAGAGGLTFETSGTVTIDSSSVNGNSTASPMGTSQGAGIVMSSAMGSAGGSGQAGTLLLRNSTVAENNASGAVGVGGNGAGLLTLEDGSHLAPDVDLNAATFATNAADPAGAAGNGGNIRLADSGGTIVRARGTIVSGGVGDTNVENCDAAAMLIDSFGGNVEGPSAFGGLATSQCGFDQSTDRHADPMLDSLGFTGGPTSTIPLLPGSPAIDLYTAGCLSTDQRGEPRPSGTACDSGAFEVQQQPGSPAAQPTSQQPPVVCAGKNATVAGSRATISGTSGNDSLRGTTGPDVIDGAGGNDTIRGLGGNDTICGDDGKDKLIGGAGNDKLIGGPGKDTLKGGAGKDKLKGGPGKDVQIQ